LLLLNAIIACCLFGAINVLYMRNIHQQTDTISRNKPSRREQQLSSPAISEAELKVKFVQECKDNRKEMVFENKQCEKVSPHPIEHAMARFIIFQRNEGYKIQDLISHYRSVVSFDNIVVIDHQGTDSLTATILNNFVEKGMHLWRCDKEYDKKHEMWSHVGQQYSQHSEFLFFLDSDEYMSILHEDELHWDPKYFLRELVSLPSNTRRPFKTRRSIPVPIDCPGSPNTQVGTGSSSSICRLQYTESDTGHYCYNKLFFRGEYFKFTDTGNHHPNERSRTLCCRGYSQKNERPGTKPMPSKNGLYTLTNFTLLHMQSLEFSDFLAHLFRGATTRGYNKEGTECTQRMISEHYCYGFEELRNAEFDMDKMRKIYEEKRCRCYEESPESKLHSVKNVFSAICHNEESKFNQLLSI